MRQRDVSMLVDYLYWLRDRILGAATRLSDDEFGSASGGTSWGSLRATLVHELDIESGWRERLRGSPRDIWERELDPGSYPTVAVLQAEWTRDEAAMRAWIGALTDEALESPATVNELDGYPTWYYILHLVTHGIQEFGDAALLLAAAGSPVRDLGFLYYADALGAIES